MCSFTFMLLDVGRHRLDDLVGMAFVVHDVSVQVAGSAKLELCRVALLALLDGDFARAGEVLVFIPHQLDEILQFLDFLRLHEHEIRFWLKAPSERLTILILSSLINIKSSLSPLKNI